MSSTRKQIMAAMMSSGGGSVTPVLPYDAEVEYLQSSGTQYIDTGIKPTTNTRVVLECSNLRQSGNENETFGYGAKVNGSRVRFHVVAVAQWNGYKFHFGCGSGILYTTTADNAKHIFELSGDGSVIQDGVNYSIGSSITSISQTMPLFARLWDGAYQYTTGVRVHSLKCYEDGALILDFIPVRVGQVGYMYDKVSGQLFGNSGSGTFILGSDTPVLPYDAEIEFLQSTGTQYINTGINAQSVRRFVVSGYCYVNGNNNTQLLGGEGQGASTFFGARFSGETHWYCTNNGSGLGDPTHRSTIDATINSTSSQTGTLTDLTNNTTYNFTSFGSASWSFPNSNLLIFGGHSTRRSPNARCYSLQIYTDSGLVRDFIPVRVGTTGYMYDKVSGELFGNNGSGSFALGNDK